MIKIRLPYNEWEPRAHQMKLWKYLNAGGKRAIAIWHRRAGKDEIGLHHTAMSMARRPGNYWHMLPMYNQARKSIWSAINPHSGKRRIDEVFPLQLRETTNDTEMLIRFRNGSTFQCVGSDTYDSLVGSSCAGLVMSELALSNPSAWGYLRPMLEENDGWALFITTPRGFNHAKDMYDHALKSEDWFAERLTVSDTGALTQKQLDTALEEYCDLYGADAGRAAYRQEYFCDWAAAVLGAYYAVEMALVREEGRILPIEAAPDGLVHRAWDLGVHDDTCIWWFQLQGAQLAILDCYKASGVGLDHYVDVIAEREHTYNWMSGNDYVPHDARVKELGTGRTRVETMRSLGLSPLLVPLASLNDGINAVRRTLPLCVFHPRCEEMGLRALEQYRREYDDEKKVFRASPLHNWASDPADAFRYLSMAWRAAPARVVEQRTPEGFYIPPPMEPRRGSILL